MKALVPLLFIFLQSLVTAQDTIGLKNGYISFSTVNFNGKLVKDSQILASLQPKSSTFDFSPYDVLSQRAANGNYHFGDITARYRVSGTSAWTSIDSAANRAAVTAATISGTIASSNLSPTIGMNTQLLITRQWSEVNGDLALTFTIKNLLTQAIEIGALGFPIEFNSIFTNRNAQQIEDQCSLIDPYIGSGAGYVQVTHVNGTGPALVITGLNQTDFQAYRFLPENAGTTLAYQSQVFEGFYEWMSYTLAWAQNEWKNVKPWNTATSRTLNAGESFTTGLRISLAKDGIRGIQSTVQASGKPYAISVPGYIISQAQKADLFISGPLTVSQYAVDIAGALTITKVANNHYTVTPSTSSWGRVRLTLAYTDGTIQTIHYYITKPAPTTIADLGNFLTTAQYFNYTNDPFQRGPSVISYDRDKNQPIWQDPRAWIAGLSDEAGAGSWLAACVKQAIQPVAREVVALEAFVSQTLWGVIQNSDYTVKKSVFFYEPSQVPGYQYNTTFNWGNWWSWNKASSYETSRAYDYVHVSAAYWSLYRVARAYPTLVSKHDWTWYLNQAYQTVMKATSKDANGGYAIGYADVGLMEETVWGSILTDLQREELTSQASALESNMRIRANNWNSQAVPYGSEMAWDSTGQEGIYYWASYFGMTALAERTLDTIFAYQPTVAHWGWNGNARRYWDNIYGGSLTYARIERMIHHYGSGLNALPLLAHFRSNLTDGYALRVGYGGISGPLSNIDQSGFGAASFHSWPDTLRWDPYSGDYGPGFLGLALGTGTYVVAGSVIGVDQDLVAFGGEVTSSGSTYNIVLKDSIQRRLFVAPFGILIEIDAGAIQSATLDTTAQTVKLNVISAVSSVSNAAHAASAVVWITNTANTGTTYKATASGSSASRGGVKVVLSSTATVVTVARA